LKFNLLDKIEFASGDRVVGVKYVTLAEEYLADHFPTFPVLPGVLMLEAVTQAAGWAMHLRRDFGCSIAVLKEARNVKYGQFVAPGNFLRVDVEFLKETEAGASFKAVGSVNGAQSLSARIELAYFNLAMKQPELADVDRRLIEHTKNRWAVLTASAPGLLLPGTLPPGTTPGLGQAASGAHASGAASATPRPDGTTPGGQQPNPLTHGGVRV
jgi:3-hydroxyacyl-[acyl-carrier-protein] dehydratase